MPSGSLTVVGVGLKFVSHVTVETRAHIEQADKVFLVFADSAFVTWATQLNPGAEVFPFEAESRPHHDTVAAWMKRTQAWVEGVLAPVREGLTVCVVFYGHPGIGLYPAHEALRRARGEGYPAQMLPGISAADCLFADLGVDPLQQGCQCFEATDFLLRRRAFSTASALILWQIGIIGEFAQVRGRVNVRGLRVLVEVLEDAYGAHHEVVVYEAASYPIVEPVIQRLPLAKVLEAQITELSTLYVPPQTPVSVDPDMLDRLGLPRSRVRR